MLLHIYGMLPVLILTSLVSGDVAGSCTSDACLQSFNRNHEQAERYCTNHPNRFLMAPAPVWAGECHSLGRQNNMRQRLASACSCLSKPAHRVEPTVVAAVISSISVPNTLTEKASSVVVPTGSPSSSSEAGTITSTLLYLTITDRRE
jgi:hypothetical protein